jgi:hypothetical protein
MPTPIDAMSSSSTTNPIMKRRIGETAPLIRWPKVTFGLWHDIINR